MDISAMRRDYMLHSLNEDQTSEDPIVQFKNWFDEATAAAVADTNAMTLATSSLDGKPTARIVLLKGISDIGFRFFTNYGSAKGMEIENNPNVALVFFWHELERQVRIEGLAQRTTKEVSEAYFHSRPFKSQISALVSPQSKIIPDKSVLMETIRELEQKYENEKVPLPEYWGGYEVVPTQIEFWQGRENRFHDRIQYTRVDGGWNRVRLAP